MSFLPGHMPHMPPSQLLEAAFLQATGFGGTSANVQFNGQNVGAAPGFGQRRYIVAGFGMADGSNLTFGATQMNGVGMTQLVVRNATTCPLALCIAELASGTTANFLATFGSTPAACYLALWRVITGPAGLVSVPFGTASAAHAAGVVTLNCNTPGNGAVFGIAQALNAGASNSNTWTGLSEQYDTDIASGEVFTAAFDFRLPAATPRAISVANTDTTPGNFAGVVASIAA